MISEECYKTFKDVFDASHFVFIAREQIRLGHPEWAITNIGLAKHHIENMKDTPEYERAKYLIDQAENYLKTDLNAAMGYLLDAGPLIEQGALQKAVACECRR